MMKRDMTLIRKLLIDIESHPDRIQGIRYDEYTQEEVNYHISLMIDVGLLDGTYQRSVSMSSMAPSRIFINSITWSGHELLDNLRREDVWNVIKTEFKNDSIETIVSVAKDLASGFAKKKLKSFLDENKP
ncbi:DUF2513 domain-containing protein [Vibrio metschnikovii]|nr:DUF2513 domain-containing protein [Vibrio metschnikovii]EKO3636429.1 DUF2513 domain-containing protein [Vibrio metschnikovii]EKO3639803.1 DUF2513 domain-containing protein [Vibrio metschnikovii]EKO3646598.1 DUF2513 domain-containing protein [Vibrio metschnikovii]EKO3650050.1 DUF2513 domain-containing protein [Vibrio metschnikovii]